MNDEKLINDLSKSIQLAVEFTYEKSIFIKENFKKQDISFNIQIVFNFFYSIIETTDGIYSLTYDKNIGSINALARIQYESVIQFLMLLSDDYKTNILSYEYHQLKQLISTNDYLINTDNKYKTNCYKHENSKLKTFIKSKKFEIVRNEIPKNLKYSNWFIVTKGHPKTITQLIRNYFQNTSFIGREAVTKYYSFLSYNVHNHNVDRFVQNGYILPIRRDNLMDAPIEMVTMFMLASLLKLIDFLESELKISTKNKNEIVELFEKVNKFAKGKIKK